MLRRHFNVYGSTILDTVHAWQKTHAKGSVIERVLHELAQDLVDRGMVHESAMALLPVPTSD